MRPLTIRPSSAARWLNCAGNPRVQTIADALPREPDAAYAAEGTLAHGWLEYHLGGRRFPPLKEARIDGEPTSVPNDLPSDQAQLIEDVADDILWYADFAGYQIKTEKEYAIELNRRGDRSPIKILGHVDVLLHNETDLVVLDYKHGAGKHVSVINNPQTMLYLLAALEGRAEEVFDSVPINLGMGIIQPRGVGDGWSMVTVDPEELLKFRARVLAAVEAAYQPNVEYHPGPHCWKCPGQRGLCPAILETAIDCVVQTPSKDVFNDAEIEDVMTHVFGGVLPWPLLDKLDDVRAFVKKLSSYADVYLKAGKSIPGWGLETVPGRRAWSHPEEVPGALAEILGGEPGDYERITKTPVTLTEAERIAKKKGKKIDGLLKKPVTQKRVKTETSNPLGFTKVE
jgi:hypothetical protein